MCKPTRSVHRVAGTLLHCTQTCSFMPPENNDSSKALERYLAWCTCWNRTATSDSADFPSTLSEFNSIRPVGSFRGIPTGLREGRCSKNSFSRPLFAEYLKDEGVAYHHGNVLTNSSSTVIQTPGRAGTFFAVLLLRRASK